MINAVCCQCCRFSDLLSMPPYPATKTESAIAIQHKDHVDYLDHGHLQHVEEGRADAAGLVATGFWSGCCLKSTTTADPSVNRIPRRGPANPRVVARNVAFLTCRALHRGFLTHAVTGRAAASEAPAYLDLIA
jgi:hypothetical protein